MAGFELLDPTATWIPHITPLNNLTLSDLQRGQFDILIIDSLSQDFPIYEPPPLELYTEFSLQSYFKVQVQLIYLSVFDAN